MIAGSLLWALPPPLMCLHFHPMAVSRWFSAASLKQVSNMAITGSGSLAISLCVFVISAAFLPKGKFGFLFFFSSLFSAAVVSCGMQTSIHGWSQRSACVCVYLSVCVCVCVCDWTRGLEKLCGALCALDAHTGRVLGKISASLFLSLSVYPRWFCELPDCLSTCVGMFFFFFFLLPADWWGVVLT